MRRLGFLLIGGKNEKVEYMGNGMCFERLPVFSF
jgi:hypothetical protein